MGKHVWFDGNHLKASSSQEPVLGSKGDGPFNQISPIAKLQDIGSRFNKN